MINNFNILAVCFMFYFITCTNRIIDTVNAQPPDGDKKDTANAQTSVGDKNVIKENYKKLSNNLSELGLSNMTIDDSEVHQTSKKLREQFNTLLNQENHKLTTKLKTYLTKENNINIYESDGNSILNTLKKYNELNLSGIQDVKKYNELNLSGIQDVNFRSDFNNLVKITTSLKLIENLAEENINVEKLNHCVYEFKNRGFLNNRTYTAMPNIAVKIDEYKNVTDFPCKRVCVVSKKYPKDEFKNRDFLRKITVDYIKEYIIFIEHTGNYPDPFEYCIDYSNKK